MNVGLTGGLGCGKSTALKLFREAGATTLDTDAMVRDLLATDQALIVAIREAFGPEAIDSEGRVDRGSVARMVFGNSEALALLESLVHPRVRKIWTQALREKYPVLIVEIPLLFEKDLQEHFSLTLCLSCDPQVQEERLKARGMSESQIQQRKSRQLDLSEKVRRADIVLHNNGTLEHLQEQVQQVMAQLR